jgi:soluble lytic murein transglycosylase-like protein
MPDYRAAARRAAIKYGLNPAIFERQIQQESGFREGVGSSAGARDIAQFMPATAKAYGVTLGDNRVTDDLDGAARYMRDNLKKYGSYARALSAYNSGTPGRLQRPQLRQGADVQLRQEYSQWVKPQGKYNQGL